MRGRIQVTVLDLPADKHTRQEMESPVAKTIEKDVKDVRKDAAQQAPAPRIDPARDSALTRAVQQIEKQFGKGAVMKLNGDRKATIDGIATGSLSLDIALGG